MSIPVILIILAFGVATALPARAVYNEAPDAAPVGDTDFDAGFSAVKAAEWRVAIDRLLLAAKRHPRSADIHNLLGFSYRKSGDLDLSFKHYDRALELDPDHRGTHEYIGEAWLMRGNPAKAREHLRELERLCRADCEEYRDLEKAIAEFERQAGLL